MLGNTQPNKSQARTHVGVNNEEASKSDSGFLDEDTVVGWDGLGEVSCQRVLQPTEATLLAGGVDPGQVREVGVSGNSDDLLLE